MQEGKERHYELGKWLRNRYSNYLPETYLENDIRVRSTDVDRTLMSAQSNLAGLYPPTGSQIWNKNISWQPIPIHTQPEKEDALLAMKKSCPKYKMLYKELEKSPFFNQIRRKNHDLYAFLSLKSGEKITSLETLEYLYNTLLIETFFNYTLPDWAQKAFPKMQPYAYLSFATACWTQELARYKTGPLFNEIVDYFTNRTITTEGNKKMLVFSAHDTTIANLLNSLGAFEFHSPPYASTLLFELKYNGEYYVNVLYKNSSVPQNITIKGCTFNCNFTDFIKILSPITLTLDQWEYECRINWLDFWPLGLTGSIVLSCVLSCIGFAGFALAMSMKFGKKSHESSYIQLPNEEYA